MNSSKYSILLSSLLIVLCIMSHGKGLSQIGEFREKPFFPIVAWNLQVLDEQSIADQAELGITISAIRTPIEMGFCEKHGLKAICRGNPYEKLQSVTVFDSAEENTLRNELEKIKGHPALYGIQIGDEPGKKAFSRLDKALSIIKAECPDKVTYINLFPNYSTPFQHGFSNYEEYVNSYCDMILKYPQPILIYDSYANKKNDYGKNNTERMALFLKNLETIRSIALQKKIPFWVTILAGAHDHYADPSAGDLNFEVFSSLAYGARGFTYFPMQSHISNVFQGGPFDLFGNRTPVWSYIQNCNAQIRMLAPIILKLQSTGVYYNVSSDLNILRDRFQILPGELVKKIECDLKFGNFLIGEFKHEDGSRWIMVVNLNLESVEHFKVELADGKSLEAYNNYTGKPCHLDTWLKPGQGKLYKIIDGRK